jgi:hypothetical protein
MVSSDGREYYAVNADAHWQVIKRNKWLMDNVVPQLLPPPAEDAVMDSRVLPKRWLVDFYHPLVKSKSQIAEEIRAFIGHTPNPELWAYYAAYDHVALAQLYGPMIELPDCIPQYTNDLKQELVRLGNPRYPAQTAGQHHALADARHNKVIYDWIMGEEETT